MLGLPRLGEQIVARGIDWHHLPIVDVRAPDERFEAAWRSSGPVLNRVFREGGRVLVHCRGGNSEDPESTGGICSWCWRRTTSSVPGSK